MSFIISFFRDVIDGWWYILYIFICLFFILVFLGMYGDKKREAIAIRLKEKKARDIASGKEARIAALESKQVLDVMEEDLDKENGQENSQPVSANDSAELTTKEEAPSVLVIGADGNSAPPTLDASLNAHQNVMNAAQENQNISMEQSSQSQ